MVSEQKFETRLNLTEVSTERVTILSKPEFTQLDYFYAGVCGVGCIIIVNCVYTDIDFFEEELPKMQVAFVFPLLIYST